MELSLYRGAKDAVNGALSLVGLKVMRARSHDWTDLANFLPLKPTLEAARDAGLSVGDYIDTVINNSPGATQDTMDRMADLGVFADRKSVV